MESQNPFPDEELGRIIREASDAGKSAGMLLGIAIIVVKDDDPIMKDIPWHKGRSENGNFLLIRQSFWNTVVSTTFRQWVDIPTHVMPPNAKSNPHLFGIQREHEMREDCWCCPDVERANDGSKIIIHRRLS